MRRCCSADAGQSDNAMEKQIPRDPGASLPKERQKVIQWLKEVKFRRKLFWGLDQRDVWNKLSQLDQLYAEALEAERVRYDTLLDQHKKTLAQEVCRMMDACQQRRDGDA